MKPTEHPDAARIKELGGPAKVAKLVGARSTQRVQNWIHRGIPPAVKLLHPALFLVDAKVTRQPRAVAAGGG